MSITRNAIRKALSVASGGNIEDYLPAPLAKEVIEYIRDTNIMRNLIPVFTQNARNWKKAKRQSGMSGYYIPDGVTATFSEYSASSVTWQAKKLMSYTMVDEEAVEDSQPDVIQQVLRDFADAIGEAEEIAMLQGDPTHLATAPTPGSATTANWYVRDARLMFTGIFPAANDASAATAVAAGAAAFNEDFINKAIFNLGKYGRNKSMLMALVPSEQAANIRSNARFKQANVSGQDLASFITGLGSAGESNTGVVTTIYGVPIHEIPFATTGEAVVMHKKAASLGDRRLIKFKSEEVIESDQRKFVVSERVSFNYDYNEALCKISDLSETIVINS
jgi:hypothetical protein